VSVGSAFRRAQSPLLWVCGTGAAAILLHAGQVPPWVTISALALIAWRLAAVFGAVRLPGGVIRVALGLALVGAVFAQFGTVDGLLPGTALLMLMVAIKLLETRTQRDEYVVIGGALFLLLAACLYGEGLAWVPLYGADAFLSCAALAIVAYAPGADDGAGTAALGLRTRDAIALAGRTLLLALPLGILLFLFFPRLPGHLWGLTGGVDAVTGLGDTMTPGSITRLTASYDIAFRVRFEGSPPPPEERYWRAIVMNDFDGATWTAGRAPGGRQQRLDCLSRPYRYRMDLEPTFGRWWLALDTVMGSPAPQVRYTDEYELVGAHRLTHPVTYSAVSCTQVRSLAPLSAAARREETRLVPRRNPRAAALAAQLRRRAGSDVAFVRAVLAYLRAGGFTYSLTPPPLGRRNPVDDFLFHTRTGFCGHFASAFVDLMRAGGVPARVVTGYLGGRLNPYDGTFIVRQSDAHAWAEVWLHGRGWTRVDPTAVVAPQRLYRGILDLLPGAVSAPERLVHAWPWLGAALERWEALNGWWNRRVVDFNSRSQLNLLAALGLHSPQLREAAWAFAATLLAWLAWVSWRFGRDAGAPPPDRLASAYLRLCRKLARTGLPRAAHQGPLSYAQAITRLRPDLASRVQPLFSRYIELRFGAPRVPAPEELRAFERAVSRLIIPAAARARRRELLRRR
jgi:transglutaminase-like putative cysteine protease